jgi:transposase
MRDAERRSVGIDVAKVTPDVQVRQTDARWSVANDEAGSRKLVEQLRTVAPTQVVLETTGGYELAVVSARAAAALPVVFVNPSQVRDFAKATGLLAKTDRLDTADLAHFPERVRPEARPLATSEQQELDALLTRRRQLIETLAAEKNRLGQVFVRGGQSNRTRWRSHRYRSPAISNTNPR